MQARLHNELLVVKGRYTSKQHRPIAALVRDYSQAQPSTAKHSQAQPMTGQASVRHLARGADHSFSAPVEERQDLPCMMYLPSN
jgi:hypothetical protein